MFQFLSLVHPNIPSSLLTAASRITFASSDLTGNVAVWWYALLQTGLTPSTWEDFKNAVMRDFILSDHLQRGRDKLRSRKQVTSVSKYITEFRNVIITINYITEGEKMDRCTNGLKMEIILEVLESQGNTFEDAVRMALRIDGVIWRYGSYGNSHIGGTASSRPVTSTAHYGP